MDICLYEDIIVSSCLSNRKNFHPYWGKIKKLISVVVSQSLQMRSPQIRSGFGLPGNI